MEFTTSTLTNAGGRSTNEDRTGFAESGGLHCWIAADGLGGHRGGAEASRLAVQTVLDAFAANPEASAEAVRAYLNAAQAAIRRVQTQPVYSQMRSTIAAVVSDGRRVWCGHLGDTRFYHLQGGRIRFQTVDHSVPGSLAANGVIAFDDIRSHEDRNRVLRSLGNEEDIEPTITERLLCQGDAFLLCTDGFWEFVHELEVEVDWHKCDHPNDWLRTMNARLLGRAPADRDNCSAVAVYFRSDRAPSWSAEETSFPPHTTPAVRGAGQRMDELRQNQTAWVISGWLSAGFLAVTLMLLGLVAYDPARARSLFERAREALPVFGTRETVGGKKP